MLITDSHAVVPPSNRQDSADRVLRSGAAGMLREHIVPFSCCISEAFWAEVCVDIDHAICTQGCELTAKGPGGKTAFEEAVITGNDALAAALLAGGADISKTAGPTLRVGMAKRMDALVAQTLLSPHCKPAMIAKEDANFEKVQQLFRASRGISAGAKRHWTIIYCWGQAWSWGAC
eukprot:scaffold230376_cov27-Prasinocladus_malaysianus.AAC.1